MVIRNIILATAAAGCIVAGTLGVASAQPGPGPGPEGFHHDGGLLAGVSLSDDQKTQLHALMKANHASSRSLFEQMRSIHEQIDTTLLSTGTVTATTLAPLVQQQEVLAQQLDAQRVTQELAIRALLTPTQLSQASSAHAQLAALHKQEDALHEAGGPPPE